MIGTTLATTLALAVVAAADAPGPLALLQGKAEAVKALMGRPPDAARAATLRELVASVVDYGELARDAIKGHWDGRTEAERTEFRDLLKRLVEKSYLENVERRPNFTVDWRLEKLLDDGTRAKVTTLATGAPAKGAAAGATLEIEYRLVRRETAPQGWIVADVVIDDVSMVRNYRRSFGKIIDKDGFAALLAKMKDKLAQ